jgi:rhodanese-related sulfurtransferase
MRRYIFTAGVGNRSGKATKLLIDAGYTNVTNAGSMSQAGEL